MRCSVPVVLVLASTTSDNIPLITGSEVNVGYINVRPRVGLGCVAATVLTRDIQSNSVCPSVCLSVTFRNSMETVNSFFTTR